MSSSRASSPVSLNSKELELPPKPHQLTLSRLGDLENAILASEEKPSLHQAPNPYLARWEPGETANPRNWSKGYRWWITVQLGLLALAASLASSIVAPAGPAVAEYAHVSIEVTVLSISL
jgi:hypothetical protein